MFCVASLIQPCCVLLVSAYLILRLFFEERTAEDLAAYVRRAVGALFRFARWCLRKARDFMRSHKVAVRRTVLGCALALAVVFANGCHYVFKGQFKSVEKLKAGKELSLYECCSVYTMHMAVWMFGWPLAPEAAKEAFLLHFPHRKEVSLSGNSVFKSKKFKDLPYGRTKISWDLSDFNSSERRYALALNGKNTEVFVYEDTSAGEGFVDDGDLMECRLTVEYTDVKVDIAGITIHESLFNYLQKKGWLHPYRARYSRLI